MKVMDILESYNTRLDLDWQDNGNSKIAFFNIEDEQYDIRIDIQELQLPTRQSPWDVYEVSFRRYMKDIPTVQQTESSYSSQLFGIIYNAVLERTQTDAPDCVIFSAKFLNDNQDTSILNKRIRIYHTIAKKLASHGIYQDISPIQSKYAHNFVLVRQSNNITTEEINWIKHNC